MDWTSTHYRRTYKANSFYLIWHPPLHPQLSKHFTLFPNMSRFRLKIPGILPNGLDKGQIIGLDRLLLVMDREQVRVLHQPHPITFHRMMQHGNWCVFEPDGFGGINVKYINHTPTSQRKFWGTWTFCSSDTSGFPGESRNGTKSTSSYGGSEHRANSDYIGNFHHLQLPQIKSELFETHVIRSVVIWSTNTYPPSSTWSHSTAAVNPFLSHSSPNYFINFWARVRRKRRPTEHLSLLKIEKNCQKKFCCTRSKR